MITLKDANKYSDPGLKCDTGLGNKMFQIAATIGIAVRFGYEYGFEAWESQQYFKNLLPEVKANDYPVKEIGWDYNNELISDNIALHGYMQDFRYWKFCEYLIRHYFEMKDICEPLENTIGIHFRAYGGGEMHPETDWNYYKKALSQFSSYKNLVVFTDDIERAKAKIPLNCEFRSGSPIEDFYLLSKCDGIICSNSTFPWWAGWLSGNKVVIPSKWFGGRIAHLSTDGLLYPNWIVL